MEQELYLALLHLLNSSHKHTLRYVFSLCLGVAEHGLQDDDDEDDSGMMIGKAKKWKRMSMARVASPSAPPPVRK